ncbi:hypothetical protein [Agarivorans gilvus]|uniref:DUF4134 domain-containing protein n=1 Tax=Agarivorans gilvus TaxID=680279 RepID=A0ABQ1HZF1_9ALTE|nr:hypothetical protein [Agarivorans gilvus]GGB01805.1 hypothetical protein GCM10007414_13770 [Agarivorans gilvus]
MKWIGLLIIIAGLLRIFNAIVGVWSIQMDFGHYLAISFCSVAAGVLIYRSSLICQGNKHTYYRSFNWVVLIIYSVVVALLSIQGTLAAF